MRLDRPNASLAVLLRSLGEWRPGASERGLSSTLSPRRHLRSNSDTAMARPLFRRTEHAGLDWLYGPTRQGTVLHPLTVDA